MLLLAGCQGSKESSQQAPKAAPHLSFRALDAQHQKLIHDYEPVSRALTAYEIAYRDWRLGRLSTSQLTEKAASFRAIVTTAIGRLRADPATGPTAGGKRLFVTALAARRRALAATPGSARYREAWDHSAIDARRGLSLLQNIRDRARLIPLPEDSVS